MTTVAQCDAFFQETISTYPEDQGISSSILVENRSELWDALERGTFRFRPALGRLLHCFVALFHARKLVHTQVSYLPVPQVAPALAAGNAVIYKASPFAPASPVLLGEILAAAGLPAGVYNVLQVGASHLSIMSKSEATRRGRHSRPFLFRERLRQAISYAFIRLFVNSRSLAPLLAEWLCRGRQRLKM